MAKQLVTPELKEKMKSKISDAVKKEIQKEKIVKRIDSIKVDDGMIMASFSIRRPAEKSGNKPTMSETQYDDFTKNFKSKEEFDAFVWGEFFNGDLG